MARKFRKSSQKKIDKKDRYRHRFRYTAVGCKLQQVSKQASKRMSKQTSQKDMRVKETCMVSNLPVPGMRSLLRVR